MDWRTTFPPFALTHTQALPELALTHLASWGAITLKGADSLSYLQGQLTCDLATLSPEHRTFGAHCDAKGKVWSVFCLFHHNKGYALFQPLSGLETELKELKKYAIFSKTQIEQSNEVALGLIGTQAQQWIDQHTQSRSDVRTIEGGSAVKISDQRWLLLITEAQAQQWCADPQLLHVDEALWKYGDITEVLPFIEHDQQNTHIPQALNLQAVGGISFTKGCYTGQETVARAKYRGINKRALYSVAGPLNTKITGDEPIVLERSVGENWRTAGNLLQYYSFADNYAVALVVLPNNLDEGTEFRLANQPEQRWKLQPLPYSLED